MPREGFIIEYRVILVLVQSVTLMCKSCSRIHQVQEPAFEGRAPNRVVTHRCPVKNTTNSYSEGSPEWKASRPKKTAPAV